MTSSSIDFEYIQKFVIKLQSRSMLNPTLSDNDFKNIVAWVWTSLNSHIVFVFKCVTCGLVDKCYSCKEQLKDILYCFQSFIVLSLGVSIFYAVNIFCMWFFAFTFCWIYDRSAIAINNLVALLCYSTGKGSSTTFGQKFW